MQNTFMLESNLEREHTNCIKVESTKVEHQLHKILI